MPFDFPTFCFQACLALLIALLAWGNQISQPRQIVKEVEKKFLLKLNKSQGEVAPIIHNFFDAETGVLKYSLHDVTKAAVKLMKGKQLNEQTIAMINEIKSMNGKKKTLESEYTLRYFATVALDCWFGITGLLSTYVGNKTINITNTLSITIDIFCICIILAIVGLILINLVLTYSIESKFVIQASEFEDNMEVK